MSMSCVYIRERGNEEATTKKIKESPEFLTIPKTEIENREMRMYMYY